MFGLMRFRTHDAEMASRKAEIAALDSLLSDRDATIEYLEARLDALTPARGQGGRFVGKVGSGGIQTTGQFQIVASNPLPTPPETTA